LIDNAHVTPGTEGAISIKENTTTLLSAMALKNAYVMQGGLGESEHLFNGLHEGMQSSRPALFNLFSAESEKHFILSNKWPKLSALASLSRAVPSIKYKPESGEYFGSSVDLSGNPSADQQWHSESVRHDVGGDEQTLEYQVTWADWAYTQRAWKTHFKELKETAGIPVSKYLAMDEGSRNGQIPVIERVKDGVLIHYGLSDDVVVASEMIAEVWNTWREMAGVITEFPQNLKEKVTAELSIKYEQDLEQTKADFEKQLQEQERNQNEAIRVKLRNKLAALSQQAKN